MDPCADSRALTLIDLTDNLLGPEGGEALSVCGGVSVDEKKKCKTITKQQPTPNQEKKICLIKQHTMSTCSYLGIPTVFSVQEDVISIDAVKIDPRKSVCEQVAGKSCSIISSDPEACNLYNALKCVCNEADQETHS